MSPSDAPLDPSSSAPLNAPLNAPLDAPLNGPAAASPADRVERLERRVRWLTSMTLLLAIAFAALIGWQLYPHRRAFSSTGFVLVDAHGKKRAELGMRAEGGPMLRLNNAEERARAALLVREDGSASLRLSDGSGMHRAEVRVGADGVPQLLLMGPDGHSMVALGLDAAGTGSIALRDSTKRTVWSAPGR